MSSPGEVPLGIRITETGTSDAMQKLRQLHDELNRGTITTKEYRTEHREINTQLKSNVALWNDSKNAIYAANPTLLEFSRTMSGFGQITAAATSGMTAINTAMLLLAGGSDSINQVKIKMADIRNEMDRLAAAGQQGTVQFQDLVNEYNQLGTVLGNLNQQFTVQQIQGVISFAAALGQIAVGAVAAGTTLKTLSVFVGGSTFATGILSWLGPIAIVIAGIEGIYQLIKLLDPEFAQAGNQLENSIMQNWHVSDIEAALLAPFVAFGGGVVDIVNHVHAEFVNLYNGILTDFINPLRAAFGNPMIPTQFYHIPSHDEILNSFGLGSTSSSTSSSGGNPNTDSINQMLVGTPFNQTSNSALNTLQQTSTYSQAISTGQQQTNQLLTGIYQTGQSANQVAQQQLQQMQEQKAAQEAVKTAISQGLTNSTAKISDLQTQLTQAQKNLSNVGGAHASAINQNGSSLSASDFPDIMAAMQHVQDIQNQITTEQQTIKSLQSKSTMLDNSTSGLSPVLASLGLSADTGIGSIVAGALGGYAGIGGAGTSAQDIANFAATGDYGIFTKNAINENGRAHTPTQQEQINAWMKSTGINDPEQAKYALGYTKGGKSSGSSNVGSYIPGSPTGFGGLPGQYGTPFNGNVGIFAASGFEGMVNGPTHFLAGEAGPEFVSISPSGKSGGNTTFNFTINVEGTVIAEQGFDERVQESFKQALKRAGFT